MIANAITREQLLAAVDDNWRAPREILCRIRGVRWKEREAGEAYSARVQITVGLKPLMIQGLIERQRSVKPGRAFEWRRPVKQGD